MLIPLGFWAASAGGGAASSFDLLETQVLSSSAASVTFSGLSTYAADYQHLQIRMATRSSGTGAPSIYVRFNSDTASNYSTHYLFGDGSNAQSGAQTSSTGMLAHTTNGARDVANAFGGGVVDILDPFETTKYPTMRTLGGETGASPMYLALASGSWRNTSALSDITLYLDSGSFVQNSRFSLYGIKVGA